jgi:hypothetical protein
MAKVFRWFVGFHNGTVNCNFDDSAIRNESVVLVSVSEGDGGSPEEPSMTTNPPGRFRGNARMSVANISPRRPINGIPGVDFRITVDWFEPLPVWVDIFVADEEPRGFFRSK